MTRARPHQFHYPYDPEAAVGHLAQTDRRLARLIERVGTFRLQLSHRATPFQALFKAIVYQQLSGHAASTIFRRVRALYPGRRPPGPRQILATDDAELRQAGLSIAKIRATKDLAEKTLRGTVPAAGVLHRLSDEEIIARVTTVRGVGPWTAEMLLIFHLGRPDVLPVRDLGIRKGFQRAYGLDAIPDPEHVREHGRRWQPYRSVASWYLWRANDLPASRRSAD